MKTRYELLSALLCLMCLALTPYPIKPSANGRYLVDASGAPFLLVGDSPHSILANIGSNDVATYMGNRAGNGFNCVWIELLCDSYTFGVGADGAANYGQNFYGKNPFTATLAGGYYDLTKSNEVYWGYVDWVALNAASNGIMCFFVPLDEGGWTATSSNNGTNRCNLYGQFLGNRYKNYTNIFWNFGNDMVTYGSWANDQYIVNIAFGIHSVETSHPSTVELNWDPSTDSFVDAIWATNLTVNGSYSYFPTYDQNIIAYTRTNVPLIFLEGSYEDENNGGVTELGTPNVLRRQAYWSLLGGALGGNLYGSYYIDRFDGSWKAHLNTPGVRQLGYFANFLTNRTWYSLVPDTNHLFVSSGYGTYSSSGHVSENNYATAALAGKTLGIVYTPTNNSPVVQLTNFVSTVTARWFDPTTNAFTAISGSPFANTGSHTFSTPGNNSEGAGDWVLLLESSAPSTSSMTANNVNVGTLKAP